MVSHGLGTQAVFQPFYLMFSHLNQSLSEARGQLAIASRAECDSDVWPLHLGGALGPSPGYTCFWVALLAPAFAESLGELRRHRLPKRTQATGSRGVRCVGLPSTLRGWGAAVEIPLAGEMLWVFAHSSVCT